MENYTTTGKILPIGLLVCSHCKEKQLRGLDFTNSQVIGPTDFPVEPTSLSSVSICPVAEKRPASGKDESNVIIHPVVRQKTQQSVKGTERLHLEQKGTSVFLLLWIPTVVCL